MMMMAPLHVAVSCEKKIKHPSVMSHRDNTNLLLAIVTECYVGNKWASEWVRVTQWQGPGSGTPEWNVAMISVIRYTCGSAAVELSVLKRFSNRVAITSFFFYRTNHNARLQ